MNSDKQQTEILRNEGEEISTELQVLEICDKLLDCIDRLSINVPHDELEDLIYWVNELEELFGEGA